MYLHREDWWGNMVQTIKEACSLGFPVNRHQRSIFLAEALNINTGSWAGQDSELPGVKPEIYGKETTAKSLIGGHGWQRVPEELFQDQPDKHSCIWLICWHENPRVTSQVSVPSYLCGSMNETLLETGSSNSGEDFVGVSNKGGAVQTYHGPNIT